MLIVEGGYRKGWILHIKSVHYKLLHGHFKIYFTCIDYYSGLVGFIEKGLSVNLCSGASMSSTLPSYKLTIFKCGDEKRADRRNCVTLCYIYNEINL